MSQHNNESSKLSGHLILEDPIYMRHRGETEAADGSLRKPTSSLAEAMRLSGVSARMSLDDDNNNNNQASDVDQKGMYTEFEEEEEHEKHQEHPEEKTKHRHHLK